MRTERRHTFVMGGQWVSLYVVLDNDDQVVASVAMTQPPTATVAAERDKPLFGKHFPVIAQNAIDLYGREIIQAFVQDINPFTRKVIYNKLGQWLKTHKPAPILMDDQSIIDKAVIEGQLPPHYASKGLFLSLIAKFSNLALEVQND